MSMDLIYLACPHCGMKTGRTEEEFEAPIVCPSCWKTGKFVRGTQVRMRPVSSRQSAAPASPFPMQSVLLAVAGVLVLIGSYCVYRTVNPGYGDGYLKHEIPAMAFSVEYPRNYIARGFNNSLSIPGGGRIPTYEFTAQGGAAIEAFMALVIDFPLEPMRGGRSDVQIAQDMFDGGMEDVGMKSVPVETFTRDGATVYRGRTEGVCRGKAKFEGIHAWCRMEVRLTPARQYCLIIVGRDPAVFTEPQGEHFFQSFCSK
jgi:hypothetical protein